MRDREDQPALARLPNLDVIEIPAEACDALKSMASRNMRLDCTIQDGQVWLSHEGTTLHFEPRWINGVRHQLS